MKPAPKNSKKICRALVCIVCDGIDSSVFHGQVFQPLLELKKSSPETPISIVSFEYACDLEKIHALIKTKFLTTEAISFVLYKKYSFIGWPNLWLAARQLKKFLGSLPAYTIRARGPLAGAIALRAATIPQCQELIIQARGLAAAEYLYDHEQDKQKNVHKNINNPIISSVFAQQKCIERRYSTYIYRLRTRQFENLERSVYALHTKLPATIEAVSPALKEYLVKEFGAPADKITIAHQDIPPAIAPELHAAWAREVRTELAIPETAHVYCYSGSIKPWQCPDLTIDFFKQELQKNSDSYLLVLTQDKNQFEKLLHESKIPANNYRVKTVAHDQVYRYLSACNTGILFRKPHVVNWVSRPTKALEYRAAGLTIAHNNTVAYLKE